MITALFMGWTDPITYASRSGGYSNTDGYDLFPEVTTDVNGDYHFYFLPQHLVKLQASTHEYIDRLPIEMKSRSGIIGSMASR